VINDHIDTFAGFPVVEFEPGDAPPDDATAIAIRLSAEFEETEEFQAKWDALFATDWIDLVPALVIGDWGNAYDTSLDIEGLAAKAGTLSSLRAVFLAELTQEESEISWIKQTDITPLLRAFPGLEVVRVRGSEGLELAAGAYPSLREFAVETGGLPVGIVHAIAGSELPALRHLELYLGTANYGGNVEVADLAPILAGANLPALTYLGLRDSEIADEVAAAVASAPIVARLRTLDLSLGILSDAGAAALLAGQPLTHLRKLDLHHHFLTAEMAERVRAELEPAGVEVDLSESELDQSSPEDRFIAVSE
jgi:hypothetical protein